MQTGLKSHVGGRGYIWLKGGLLRVVPHFAMRCLYGGRGVHLVYVNQSSHIWPQDVSAWGNVRLTFCLIGSQPASQPAAIGQPTSHVTKYQPVRLWVGQMVAGRQGTLLRPDLLVPIGHILSHDHSSSWNVLFLFHLFPVPLHMPNEACSLAFESISLVMDLWN